MISTIIRPRSWSHHGFYLCGLLLVASLMGKPSRAPAETGDAVVVIYNSKSADSRRVAEHYAQRREVPTAQLLGLDLPLSEEISRGDFQARLQQPLFDWLVAQQLFTFSPSGAGAAATNSTRDAILPASARIRYAVLCYGVPLKIRAEPTLAEEIPAATRSELRRNEAAVDSELVWLPRLRQHPLLAGLITNHVYGTANPALLHPTNGVLVVARLDGPTADIACGLVDKAVAAERDGLWGRAYVDMRGLREGSYKVGDEVMHGAAMACAKLGFDVAVDLSPKTLPKEYPLSQVAIYAGWYAGSACGPFAAKKVEFMPGAFAYHLHSFSAATLRSTNANWVGPLLARGATVSLGSVYEPYLTGTSDVGTLLRNWLQYGFSFGEAAWSAEFGLSWQTTVVGDPLYRPFRQNLSARAAELERRKDARVEWAYAMQADQLVANSKSLPGAIHFLRGLSQTRSSPVLSEKLGDLLRAQNALPEALEAYQTALRVYPSPQQAIRLLLACADLQTASGANVAALATLKQVLTASPAWGDDTSFRERLLRVAIIAGDEDMTRDCQAALRRLSGNTSTNPPSGAPRPAAPSS